jgi:multidrug efflux system outer membrane protein
MAIALRNNPETRRQWEAARSAAARFGATMVPYYPQADVQSVNGYERSIIELPGEPGKLEQWQSQPVMEITYTPLDFGRRHSAADAARNCLIANNFILNRAIQNVAFGTQSAFYAVDAAQAAVSAVQKNLALVQTDFDEVNQCVDLGLATEPELLPAKERVAQSRFDFAIAHLLVHDAEAHPAVALGVPANSTPQIQRLEREPVPKSLNAEVDVLIAQTRRQRPDLAARVASLRAGEAEVRQPRAQFFPVVGLSATYGENLWNYTFASPRTAQKGPNSIRGFVDPEMGHFHRVQIAQPSAPGGDRF